MERKFFWIVRLVGLLIASASLLVVLVSGYMSFDQYTTTANEAVAPPKVELSKYKAVMAEEIINENLDGEESVENNNTPSTNENDPLQKEYDAKFNSILSSLNGYATKEGVNQSTVSEEGLRNYISEQMSDYYNDIQILYITQLAQESELLLKSVIDVNPIEWSNFVEWFTLDFKTQWANEQERIQMERMAASQEKEEALTTLAFTGGGLIVFMFFTMILVLLRIEINTRKD